MTGTRHLLNILPGVSATDGAGVQLTRMVGTAQLNMLDPFLMLDCIDSEDLDRYIAGFPNHPHRGFETVTIMLDGLMRHKDSVGNDGLLRPGDVQWMTAGSGIIHSEIPEMVNGKLRGFQLWVNLPSEKKMMPPAYQDIPSAVIPTAHFDGGIARVIAGSYFGIEGPAKGQIPIRILDVGLKPYEEWRVDTTSGNELFTCVYDGTIESDNKRGNRCTAEAPAIILFEGNGDVIVAAGRGGANILYCEGRPINEPVVKYGPFVMNTREEVQRAVEDFNSGRLVNV